jgi:hypothetical protein
MRKLTELDKAEIRRRVNAGERQNALAVRYGVSPSTISKVLDQPLRPVGRPPREGRRFIDSQGYAHVRVGKAWMPEHRVVMMGMLGRELRKGESVHHKNGRRADNSVENLELWVGPIRPGARATDLLCPHCQQPWLADAPTDLRVSLTEVEGRLASGAWSISGAGPDGFSEPVRKLAQAGGEQ